MTTLLLIEDATDLAQVIARELEAADYEVLHAADGVQALEMHARHQPDLVILDWMLPRLDGLEVLREIRRDSAIPVLMLTARDEEADRVIGLELGADDYLTKPFSMRELIISIQTWVSLRWKSLVVTCAVGIALTVAGVFIIHTNWGDFWPWALPGGLANEFSEGMVHVPELLFGSLGGVVAALLGGWDVARRDVL
jgi:CheY-like chemotaxis protein